jgi:flagellar protein FlaJ
LFIGIAVCLLSVGIGYLTPVFIAYSRGSSIDANLPYIAHFMGVLASSGMTPEMVFRSLARVGKEYSVSKEVVGVIGEIELLGADLHTSLKRVSEVSPSKKFGQMLNGIVSTSHMGGDLAEYLNQQARKYKEERIGKIKRFLENLGVIAEAYVAFMVAAPLMLIIMLSVMSFIGGPVTLLGLNPIDLLNLLTFVLIPTGIAFLIFMVDSITPLR